MPKDRPILLLALAQTLAWAAIYYSFPALLLRWEATFGWSKAELTAAITLAILTSAICSPLSGRIIDAGKGPHLMAGSALLGAAGLVLMAAVTELWQFFALWGVLGVAMSGCLYEPCFALITRTRGPKAKQAIIFVTLVAGFAGTISFPTLHTLSGWVGWRAALILFAGVLVVLVAPAHWVAGRVLEAEAGVIETPEETVTEARYGFLRRPTFWFLAIGFGLVAVVHGAIIHHLLPVLDEAGLPAELAVLAASFIGPMQVAGRLAMMASERYVSTHGVAIVAFMSLACAAMLLSASAVSPTFLSLFVILFGGAWGTVSIIRPVIARGILGERNFGIKSGAIAVPFLVGGAFAPYLGSLVWGAAGYGALLPLLAGLSLVGCGLYVTAFRLAQRR